MTNRRFFFRALAGVLALTAASVAAFAQDYPNRRITLVVGSAPGGIIDTFARLVADKLKDRVGQPVLVENRVGNGSLIATEYVARAAPDGYTLMTIFGSNFIPSMVKDLRVNMLRDFEPILNFFDAQLIMVSATKVPARNLAEFVAYAKANPGKVNYGYTSNNVRLMSELIAQRLDIRLTGVPYKGEAPIAQAIQANEIELHIGTPTPYKGVGRDRATILASVGTARSPVFPDVPSTEELGLRGLNIRFGMGFWAPAGTPKAIATRLNREMVAIANMPDVRNTIENVFGARVIASTPEGMVQQYKEEVAVYEEAVKLMKFEPQ